MTLRDVISWSLRESDAVRTLSGDVVLTGVTSVDPAIADARVGEAIGAFNPVLSTGYIGGQVSEPPDSFFGPGLASPTRYDQGTFTAKLTQPLITGGAASIGFGPPLGYLYFPNGASSGSFNPAYTADLFVRLNQPILRGGGIRRTLAPIRIAKARADQTTAQVQAALNSQIRSLAEAYWELQAAHTALRAVDSVIPLAEESVRLERLRFQAEQVIQADVARAEVQVEELLRARYSAVQEVVRRNIQLNQLIGVMTSEMAPIVPVDVPVSSELKIDLNQATETAIAHNPNLASLRRELDIRALELQVARRDRLPAVNAFAEGRSSGLSNTVGGSVSQSGSFDYSSWTLGLTFEYPLGNAQARNRLKAAELELTRDQIILQRSQQQVGYRLASLENDLEAAWQRHISARRQVDQSQQWLRLSGLRYAKPLPASRSGNWLLLALVDYQNAQRGYVEAVTTAATTLAEYNAVLARLDEVQGVSFERWNVLLSGAEAEEPSPSPIQSYRFAEKNSTPRDDRRKQEPPSPVAGNSGRRHEWESVSTATPLQGAGPVPTQGNHSLSTGFTPTAAASPGTAVPNAIQPVAPTDWQGYSFFAERVSRNEFHRHTQSRSE